MKFLEGPQCCEKAVWPDQICPDCLEELKAYQLQFEDDLDEEVAEDHVHGILPECPEDVGRAE